MNRIVPEDHVDIALSARNILRGSPKGALGTQDQNRGAPHVSLVLCATDEMGAPILLLSNLALHTQNILENDVAGLLLDGWEELDEPLTGGRLSLTGQIRPCLLETVRLRFLNRHKSAALYADFADFSFYRFEISRGHYVGGFGVIHEISKDDLLVDSRNASALFENEAEIIAHMNADHGDVVGLIATELNGAAGGRWRLTGIDQEGCDLMNGFRAIRHNFRQAVETPDDARRSFIELAELARNRG